MTASPLSGNLGAIDQAGARVFYNPFGGFAGSDSFQFTATAGTLLRPRRRFRSTSPRAVVEAEAEAEGRRSRLGSTATSDGFFAGQDCNDGNAGIRPGAVEVKGNRPRRELRWAAEPFPTVTSGVASNWDVKGAAWTLDNLQVTQQFPKGGRF